MNWNRPRADEVEALAVGLKLDSIFAVASRYSKLVPVVEAACLMAPAMRARDGSMPAAAVALEASTDMYWCPAPSRNDRAALLSVINNAHAAVTLRRLWLMAG